MSDLPSIVNEIEWLTGALETGFKPGEPVDDELLTTLVEHLGLIKQLADLLETEIATSRGLLEQAMKRMGASPATLHPQPEKIQ